MENENKATQQSETIAANKNSIDSILTDLTNLCSEIQAVYGSDK